MSVKTINLINPELSGVAYSISQFPDGELHFSFMKPLDHKKKYCVKCRITNGNDLFIVAQVGNILNRCGVEWTLDIFYLMSMRMDRVISFLEPFSLEIVANIINSLHVSEVRILHPHSDRTFKLINNSKNMEGIAFPIFENILASHDYIICYPDAGAKNRYNANLSCYTNYSIIECTKQRNSILGFVEKVSCNNPEIPENIPIIVVDDLCDGGGTFIRVAEKLKELYPNNPLHLAVIHAIQIRGLIKLLDYYEKIYITNSYMDMDEISDIEKIDVISKF